MLKRPAWRTLRILTAALLILNFGISCSRPSRSDITSSEGGSQVTDARDFTFAYGIGGWGTIDSTVRISGDGTITCYQIQDASTNSYNVTTLQIEESDLARLKSLLDAASIMELENAYIDPDVADGTQRYLKVQADDLSKSIYFSNLFPEELEGVFRLSDELVQQCQKVEESRLLTAQQARTQHPLAEYLVQ